MNNAPIGIFDSGLGGLTVVAAAHRILPNESFIYLGDTARVPYGNRSVETVKAFAREDLQFLLKRKVKAVVAACNTVSSIALDDMQKEAGKIPVSGVILPGVQAVAARKVRSVAVIGTRGTIRSMAYENGLKKLLPEAEIRSVSCPLFVPIVEEGILDGPVVQQIIDLYLQDLKSNPPELLIPGCTHYPLLRKALQQYLPSGVEVLDSASVCAESLKSFLEAHDMQTDSTSAGRIEMYVTDMPENFRIQARRFLGVSSMPSVELAAL